MTGLEGTDRRGGAESSGGEGVPSDPGSSSDDRRAGELLPERTSDEGGEGWGDRDDGSDDERYFRERPPHHGD